MRIDVHLVNDVDSALGGTSDPDIHVSIHLIPGARQVILYAYFRDLSGKCVVSFEQQAFSIENIRKRHINRNSLGIS